VSRTQKLLEKGVERKEGSHKRKALGRDRKGPSRWKGAGETRPINEGNRGGGIRINPNQQREKKKDEGKGTGLGPTHKQRILKSQGWSHLVRSKIGARPTKGNDRVQKRSRALMGVEGAQGDNRKEIVIGQFYSQKKNKCFYGRKLDENMKSERRNKGQKRKIHGKHGKASFWQHYTRGGGFRKGPSQLPGDLYEEGEVRGPPTGTEML